MEKIEVFQGRVLGLVPLKDKRQVPEVEAAPREGYQRGGGGAVVLTASAC